MDSAFFDEKIEKTERYIYRINRNSKVDDILLNCAGEVEIVFVNDKFKSVTYPFGGIYSRGEWKVLAEVEKKISEIEEMKGDNND